MRSYELDSPFPVLCLTGEKDYFLFRMQSKTTLDFSQGRDKRKAPFPVMHFCVMPEVELAKKLLDRNAKQKM